MSGTSSGLSCECYAQITKSVQVVYVNRGNFFNYEFSVHIKSAVSQLPSGMMCLVDSYKPFLLRLRTCYGKRDGENTVKSFETGNQSIIVNHFRCVTPWEMYFRTNRLHFIKSTLDLDEYVLKQRHRASERESEWKIASAHSKSHKKIAYRPQIIRPHDCSGSKR